MQGSFLAWPLIFTTAFVVAQRQLTRRWKNHFVDHLPAIIKTLVISVDGETALSLMMGFLSFIGMVIMITYTVCVSCSAMLLRCLRYGIASIFKI